MNSHLVDEMFLTVEFYLVYRTEIIILILLSKLDISTLAILRLDKCAMSTGRIQCRDESPEPYGPLKLRSIALPVSFVFEASCDLESVTTVETGAPIAIYASVERHSTWITMNSDRISRAG